MFIKHLPHLEFEGSKAGTIGSVKEYALGVFLLSDRERAGVLRNELCEVLAVMDNSITNYDREAQSCKRQ